MPVSPSRKIGYVGIRAPTEAEAAEGRAETTSAHLTVGFEKNPRAQRCWQPATQTYRWKDEEWIFTCSHDAVVMGSRRYLCEKCLFSCQIVEGG